jgi:hypothetical protein
MTGDLLMSPTIDPAVLELVARFHGTLILLERFDNEHVRPRIETKEDHPPRELAIVSTYLRSLAHVRTFIELTHGRHFQAIAIVARALFELAVELPLIDKVDNGPEKHRLFSEVERLRTGRQIVAFHATGDVDEPLEYLWVYEKFIADHALRIDTEAKAMWPANPQPNHWSAMKLSKRVASIGAPFEEIYNTSYAQLSWYTHPGVAVVSTLDVSTYPAICGDAYGIAIRCYVETLKFMVGELKLREQDLLIDERLDLARMQAFAADRTQAEALRRALLDEV